MVKTLEALKIIKPHHPKIPSALASILYTFSRRKPYGKNSGLYKLGHGEKSVVWYWEFDTWNRYFHEFQTVDFTEAMKIYEKSKFDMWYRSWRPPT
jgi:hypothetical protein